MKNDHLNPFPSGWFVAAFSHELKKGKVISKTFMGQEIVIFRTQGGVASALDAHCPHLGAHLGHGGYVEGDCLRCPFHHFEFDTEGSCNKSKHLKAKNWSLIERDGFILLYHGDLDKKHLLPDLTQEGWKLQGHYSTNIKSHPQQTIENIFDVTHFSSVHKMVSAQLTELSEKNGVFTGIYQFQVNLKLLGRSWKLITTRNSFEIFGLGYSLSKTHLAAFGVEIAVLTAPTPINEQLLHFKELFFIKKIESCSLIHRIILPFLLPVIFKQIVNTVREDLIIWNHQQYIAHPHLLPGESSIALFRKWTKRFYD